MPAAHPIAHILLIDDEEDCNFVTRMVLKRSGFTGRITCFTNANAALEHLRADGDRPDLMFVDINMPGMTGFDLVGVCEADGILPNDHTSVVMFSSSNRPCDMDQARRFRSVVGYVEKALTSESFEHVVAVHQARKASANPPIP